jgi:hypothetical protein
MPKGPKGEKRPADAIGAAVMVGRIATGEISERPVERDPAAIERGRKGGKVGGKARAKKLSKAERTAIAHKAAKSRWGQEPN